MRTLQPLLETSERLQNSHVSFERFVNPNLFPKRFNRFVLITCQKVKETSILAEMNKSIFEKNTFHVFCGKIGNHFLSCLVLSLKAAT